MIASTVVAVLAGDDEVTVLWAGDSRVYRWRDGALRQLTVDHSRVQELVEAGRLRPHQAAGHPESNIVTRAIGTGHLEFGVVHEPVLPGDRFLLCSDGLTNMVSDTEIAEAIAAAPPPVAARRLVDLVLEYGAIDNVTVVIAEARAG